MNERDQSVLRGVFKGQACLYPILRVSEGRVMCLCVPTQKNKPKYQSILSLKKPPKTLVIFQYTVDQVPSQHILHDYQHKLDPTPMNTREYYTPQFKQTSVFQIYLFTLKHNETRTTANAAMQVFCSPVMHSQVNIYFLAVKCFLKITFSFPQFQGFIVERGKQNKNSSLGRVKIVPCEF